jgi:pantothenate kinase-related protein Tda10
MHTTNSGRVFHYYLPVFYWFEQTLAKHRESSAKPLVVGISAPQGCGKTTLVTALETLSLYGNKFTTLPDSIAALAVLKTLYLFMNSLAKPQSSAVEAWLTALRAGVCTVSMPVDVDGGW